MKALLRSEPAVFVGALQAAIVLAVAFGLDVTPEQVAAVTAFAAAVFALFLRQTVASPATIVDVAGKAATQTAEALDGPTVGAIGTVTRKAEPIITDTVDRVVGELGGLVGVLAPKAGGGS